MNRHEKEIRDVEEMEAILREAEIGRLGTSVEGTPYIVPLSFAYHDGRIVFHCAGKGKKLDGIAENPRVCFEVDGGEVLPAENPCDFTYRYRSVIAHGEAKAHRHPGKLVEVLRLLVDKYAPGMSSQVTEESVSRYDDLAVVEITVDEMTGKKSPP